MLPGKIGRTANDFGGTSLTSSVNAILVPDSFSLAHLFCWFYPNETIGFA